MKLTTYVAQVRIRCNGGAVVRPVVVDAMGSYNAKLQLEAIYGKDCLVNYPIPRR